VISDLLGAARRRLPVRRLLPAIGLLGLALIAVFYVPMSPGGPPWLTSSAALSVVSSGAIFAIVAVATGMFVNLTGLVSVAQAGLWGLGSYAAAVALNHLTGSFWLSFVFAVAVPLIIAWPMAAISLRTRGTAFIIVTLAFSEFIVLVLANAGSLTGGFNGITYSGTPSPIGPLHFDSPVQLYYLDLFVLLIAITVYWLLRRSKFGRRVTAVRDNQDLGQSLSVNSYLHRLVVFEISAALTGLAGPLLLVQQQVITPDLFNTTQFLSVYLMIMLGGLATIAGPVVGAWIVVLLPQWIDAFTSISPNVQQLIYGILLVFFVLVARKGVIGQASVIYRRLIARREAGRGGTPGAVRQAGGSGGAVGGPGGGAAPAVAADADAAGGGGAVLGRLRPRELSPEVVFATSGLSHHFGANRVLSGLDFDLRAGEIRGLIGPNGSGKTTMLNCSSGYIRPAGGRITLRGRDIAGRRFDKVSSLGLVRTFQQPEIFASFTPRQTCELVLSSVGALGGGRIVNERLPGDAGYYLELCALREVADVSSAALPYGQTRLLGVAAALARRPYVLMLDEPAAGLAQQDRARLGQVILQAREAGVSIVIVDHDMSFLLPLCDRLTVFDYGEKLAEGDPLTVCRDPRVITAYLGSEFAGRHAAADRQGTSAEPEASR
jgi:ABC-type branched-subunit amino acid transport system ATPase component/ABC-type branched-subunit amino acid transport system permease subunit